ncbi:hypothetical protein V8F20_010685 [Naviculisporaceae sp. PSN 640]
MSRQQENLDPVTVWAGRNKRKRGNTENETQVPELKRTRLQTRRALETARAGPSFQLFPNLPIELQMLIWELAPAERRVISIVGGSIKVDSNQSVAPNPVTQACSLARKMTKRRLISVKRPVDKPTHTPDWMKRSFVPFDFDPVWDIGYIEDTTFQMHDHLFPERVHPIPFQPFKVLRELGPIPWEAFQTVAISTGVTWNDVRFRSEDGIKKMTDKARELFPNAKRIFLVSYKDESDWRLRQIPAKVLHADEIPELGIERRTYFETERAPKQSSWARTLGDNQYFLQSNYVPNEEDLDLEDPFGPSGQWFEEETADPDDLEALELE